MDILIKLIWDFYGLDSHKIAIHHKAHLIEYFTNINYPIIICEVIMQNEFDSYVYVVVKDEDKFKFRDILKPKRAELYEN